MAGQDKTWVKGAWDAKTVRALRRYLEMTQQQLAEEMGARQQTISEWETGLYQPRGTARKLLAIIAERSAFPYHTAAGDEPRTKEDASAEQR